MESKWIVVRLWPVVVDHLHLHFFQPSDHLVVEVCQPQGRFHVVAVELEADVEVRGIAEVGARKEISLVAVDFNRLENVERSG